jgi:branched-chain amino acid transport system substrate-binding protein
MNLRITKAISTIVVVVIVVIIVIAAGVGIYLATSTSKSSTTTSSTTSTTSQTGTSSTSTSSSNSTQPVSCNVSGSTFCFPAKPKGSNASLSGTVTIGVLTDETSALSSIGIPIGDATQIAIQDINNWLAGTQWAGKVNFNVTVQDYALNSQTALSKLGTMQSQGIRVVVGPLNSGTAGAIYSTAASDNIVLISPSSTSVLLAGVSPYLYRTVPNDAFQGLADARMMYQNGVRNVIIVYTNQAYGSGLANSTSSRFKALGGNVTTMIPYTPSSTDFTSVLSLMASAWTTAVHNAGGNASAVAIQAIGYQDVGTLLLQAKTDDPQLLNGTQPWYGTDGESDNPAFVNSTFASVSSQVRLPATLYSFTNTSATNTVCAEINAKAAGGCDGYSLGAYDDTWLAADSILQCGTYSGTCLSTAIPQVANESVGVTGPMTLGSNHDRIANAYQIWAIATVSGTVVWQLAGNWTVSSDTVTWNSNKPKF